MATSEVVVFKGTKFRRYPESKRRSDRVYFTPGIADKMKGVKRLHEELWIDANGPIPEGHHVHHLDHDPLNNGLDNLECMPGGDHHRYHAATPEMVEYYASDGALDHLANIRPLTVEWHRSPEGREWHRQHAIKCAAARKDKPGTCEQCGNAFISKKPDRFCSNKCKSAWRRDSGVDDETRTCAWCETEYVVNKYRKTRFCSKKCAAQLKSLKAADARSRRAA